MTQYLYLGLWPIPTLVGVCITFYLHLFDFCFVYDLRWGSNCTRICIQSFSFPSIICWNDYFSPFNFLGTLFKNKLTICLQLCQHHHILIAEALQQGWKSETSRKHCSAILGHLQFRFRFFLNSSRDFDRNYTESWVTL